MTKQRGYSLTPNWYSRARINLFYFIRTKLGKNYPVGVVLPWWILIFSHLLFPIDCLYYYMHSLSGYQPRTNTWKIKGRTYADNIFWSLHTEPGNNRYYNFTTSPDGVIRINYTVISEELLKK